MNRKKTILVVTGTRAEYGLLKHTLKKIRSHPQLELRLLVTGMHSLKKFGYTAAEISAGGFTIDDLIPINPSGTMLSWFGEELQGIYRTVMKKKPDLVLILGDRDEPLAAAITAAHLGIPVAHIHGGDVSGNVTVDDKIRDAITSFSELHFPISPKSAQRIKRILGRKAKNVYVVGPLGIEDFTHLLLTKKQLAYKYSLAQFKPWLLFVMHPSPFEAVPIKQQINASLEALAKITDSEILGILPNSDTGSEIFFDAMKNSTFFSKLFPSLPRQEYLSFLACISALVGNTSSGILEAPYFSTPVVNIGRRQELRGNYKYMQSVGYNTQEIFMAISKTFTKKRRFTVPKPNNPTSSEIITDRIIKYLFP